MNRFKKSFTLLELLVVIGLLAILISLGMVAFSSVQKRARDSKRRTDLQSMQKMMEQCYSINSFSYPIVSGSGGMTISATCPVPTPWPFSITDPASNIFTVPTTTTASYVLTTALESSAVGTTFTVSNQQ